MNRVHGPDPAGTLPSRTSIEYRSDVPSRRGSRSTTTTSSGVTSPSSTKANTAFGGSAAKLLPPSDHRLTKSLVWRWPTTRCGRSAKYRVEGEHPDAHPRPCCFRGSATTRRRPPPHQGLRQSVVRGRQQLRPTHPKRGVGLCGGGRRRPGERRCRAAGPRAHGTSLRYSMEQFSRAAFPGPPRARCSIDPFGRPLSPVSVARHAPAEPVHQRAAGFDCRCGLAEGWGPSYHRAGTKLAGRTYTSLASSDQCPPQVRDGVRMIHSSTEGVTDD